MSQTTTTSTARSTKLIYWAVIFGLISVFGTAFYDTNPLITLAISIPTTILSIMFFLWSERISKR
jgi:hypothetical protein